MEYHYTFIIGDEYITVKGSGENPHDLKGIKWVSSPNASGVLKQMMKVTSGYSPTIGFVAFDDYPNDFYVQIARFGGIYKDEWRFKETNLPAIPVESTGLGKAKTKLRVYVRASSGRKAHYRMQDVGREEVEPVENLWEITRDRFGRLVSGSKLPLQMIYIEEHFYRHCDPHPKLEYLVGLMNERMQELHSPPIFEEFTEELPLHERAVFQALGAHERVPLHVLKDYPEAAYSYEIDISDEALEQEPPQSGEYKHLYEMPKDEYDEIIAEVTKDYEDNPLNITDAMLKKEYPKELEDTKRSARMRKKIFDNLPPHLKTGFCPETMNLHLHGDIVQHAAMYGKDVPKEVKNEYPMLFKDVPINFSPTGDKESDDAINAILGEVRDKVLDPMSIGGVGSMTEIHEDVMAVIGSTGESVNAEVVASDFKAGELMRLGMDDISNLISPKLLERIKDTGKNIRIKYNEYKTRADFDQGTINLSRRVLNTKYMTYSQNTICHEYGHAIEHMIPEVKSACGEFLDRRTRDDAMTPLSDMCPGMGYTNDEVTRVDRFMSPYIGKHYSDRSTEVLSMGMGYLTGSQDTEQMYVEDPEYLGFVIGVMAGKVGLKRVEKILSNKIEIEINLSKLNT